MTKVTWMCSIVGAIFAIVQANGQGNTFPASGNVGIGTTTPATSLEVNGSALLDGGGPLYLQDINHGVKASFGQGVTIFTYGVPSGIFLQQVTGNVGLGTTSPASRLHLGVGSGDGVTIGNPNDPLGNGGTYAIKFYGFRDIVSNGISAKIAAERTNSCCNWLSQGTDLAFYTTGLLLTPNADNSLERLRIKDNGNVGIGTTSPGALLEVNGNVKLTAGSGASMTFPDGTVQSTAWNGVLSGGDYAESVDVIGDRTQYQPGDLLVIDAQHPDKFLKANEPYSQMIAGVYSTKPGLTGRRMATAKSAEEVPMAMMGIVPTKVSSENGAIKPGDLLVSSSSAGYAMRGTSRDRMMGAVIGKAMGNLDTGKGVIEVLVYLQ